MPNRILREGILTSERVALLNWAEEVFFRRLMSVVDDYGRYTANPKLIRAACYPLIIDKVSDADVGKWLAKCAEAALVSVYPATDGKRYLQLNNFRQQTRSAASKYPAITGECSETPDKRLADDSHTTNERLADDSHTSTVFGDGDGDVYEDVKKSKQKKAAETFTQPFTLPDWINASHWDAWRSHPKLKNASDKQKSVAVEKLRNWRDAGEDFAGALENAALSGYQGLFLPDNKRRQVVNQPESFKERDDRVAKERWEEMTGQKHPDLHQRQAANVIDITPAFTPIERILL